MRKKKERKKMKKMTKCARPAGKNVDASNIHTSIINLTKVLLLGTEVVLIAMFSSGCLVMDSRGRDN